VGLQRGDTVCIHSFNSIVYPLIVLAIIGASGVSIGTNPSYTQHELSYAVKVAKVRFVIAEPEILPNVMIALQEMASMSGSDCSYWTPSPASTSLLA
jgi:long-subunit acyl-CoA synthetase (AMP-forming)